MKYQVRFRFNKLTGEVEEFRVDDRGEAPPQADHDSRHERVAGELGRLLERHPRLQELSGAEAVPVREDAVPEAGEGQAEPDRLRQR